MMKTALAMVPFGAWTLAGMLIFLTMFLVLSVGVLRMSKRKVDELSALPLEENGEQS